MGLTFTKLFNKLFSKKEMRILMVRWCLFPASNSADGKNLESSVVARDR
tara:strand:- start:224 stop:370 length:147 start_codon:yes stop_codon:yes gene_type:complete